MEKLWTAAEVARHLGLDEVSVEGLVREGRLTGYQLGGQYLRFRPDQVKALRGSVSQRVSGAHASKRGTSSGWPQRAREFFYFYDFYVISVFLLASLVVYLVATG